MVEWMVGWLDGWIDGWLAWIWFACSVYVVIKFKICTHGEMFETGAMRRQVRGIILSKAAETAMKPMP